MADRKPHRDPYGSERLHRGRAGRLYVEFIRGAYGYTDDAEYMLSSANPAKVRAIKRGLLRVVDRALAAERAVR